MKNLVNKRILIISPEGWDHIPVSKHHYARTLAAHNNTVYFLNPPSDRNLLQPAKGCENLMVVEYTTLRGINRLPRMLRDGVNSRIVKQIKTLCNGAFDVVWTFDSFRFQNLRLWEASLNVYHVVDVHSSPLEHQLAGSADVVLTVSQLIYDRFVNRTNTLKAKINHGLASYFFDAPPGEHNGNRNQLKAGYVGNLDNWCLDKQTLLRIVAENPDVDFHFIGPFKEEAPLVTTLQKLRNCYLVGRVESEKLPELFRGMDLFLMCYNGADKVVNSNHHKILEFLSTGKPAVINFTDEYKDTDDLVVMADTNDQLPALFKQVRSDIKKYSTPDMMAKRRAFAQSNSYEAQLLKIDNLVESLKR
jgi:glycosyltransferase involved in cell wall biosynthesis